METNKNNKENQMAKSQNIEKVKLITQVKIINYPSKEMVLDLLNNFLSENNYLKDYKILERSIYLLIKFKESDIAYSFVKKLNYEKLINPMFSSIEITMNVDVEKKKKSNTSFFGKSSSAPKFVIKKNSNIINNKNNKTENSIDFNKNNYEKPIIHHKNKFSEIAYNSILASTPYREPYEEENKKRKMNKLKWVSKRNFDVYIGKKNYFYHDFISNGIPSVPISFRPVDKNKWVSKNDFLVC